MGVEGTETNVNSAPESTWGASGTVTGTPPDVAELAQMLAELPKSERARIAGEIARNTEKSRKK